MEKLERAFGIRQKLEKAPLQRDLQSAQEKTRLERDLKITENERKLENHRKKKDARATRARNRRGVPNISYWNYASLASVYWYSMPWVDPSVYWNPMPWANPYAFWLPDGDPQWSEQAQANERMDESEPQAGPEAGPEAGLERLAEWSDSEEGEVALPDCKWFANWVANGLPDCKWLPD